MRNNVISKIIYKLRRQFGGCIKLQWRQSNVSNLETGTKTVIYSGIKVKQAIVFPEDFSRDRLASLLNIKHGGYWDAGSRLILIEAGDLPPNFEIKLDYFIIYNKTRYELKNIQTISDNAAYLILATKVTGALTNELFDINISDGLYLQDDLVGTSAHIDSLIWAELTEDRWLTFTEDEWRLFIEEVPTTIESVTYLGSNTVEVVFSGNVTLGFIVNGFTIGGYTGANAGGSGTTHQIQFAQDISSETEWFLTDDSSITAASTLTVPENGVINV